MKIFSEVIFFEESKKLFLKEAGILWMSYSKTQILVVHILTCNQIVHGYWHDVTTENIALKI